MEELGKKPARSRDAGMWRELGQVFGILILASMAPATSEAQDCEPPCRDGYLCLKGRCIEACNPPCAEGEQCVGNGQCVPEAPPATAGEPTYAPASTGAAADRGEKPSTVVPATFVGLGGFLLIAGGVTFGTSEWSGYYYDVWGTGQYVGASLMVLGVISLATATPFLVRQVKAKRDWERQQAGIFGPRFSVAPIVAPTPRTQAYGLSLRGTF
jgi:hypothetical protein